MGSTPDPENQKLVSHDSIKKKPSVGPIKASLLDIDSSQTSNVQLTASEKNGPQILTTWGTPLTPSIAKTNLRMPTNPPIGSEPSDAITMQQIIINPEKGPPPLYATTSKPISTNIQNGEPEPSDVKTIQLISSNSETQSLGGTTILRNSINSEKKIEPSDTKTIQQNAINTEDKPEPSDGKTIQLISSNSETQSLGGKTTPRNSTNSEIKIEPSDAKTIKQISTNTENEPEPSDGKTIQLISSDSETQPLSGKTNPRNSTNTEYKPEPSDAKMIQRISTNSERNPLGGKTSPEILYDEPLPNSTNIENKFKPSDAKISPSINSASSNSRKDVAHQNTRAVPTNTPSENQATSLYNINPRFSSNVQQIESDSNEKIPHQSGVNVNSNHKMISLDNDPIPSNSFKGTTATQTSFIDLCNKPCQNTCISVPPTPVNLNQYDYCDIKSTRLAKIILEESDIEEVHADGEEAVKETVKETAKETATEPVENPREEQEEEEEKDKEEYESKSSDSEGEGSKPKKYLDTLESAAKDLLNVIGKLHKAHQLEEDSSLTSVQSQLNYLHTKLLDESSRKRRTETGSKDSYVILNTRTRNVNETKEERIIDGAIRTIKKKDVSQVHEKVKRDKKGRSLTNPVRVDAISYSESRPNTEGTLPSAPNDSSFKPINKVPQSKKQITAEIIEPVISSTCNTNNMSLRQNEPGITATVANDRCKQNGLSQSDKRSVPKKPANQSSYWHTNTVDNPNQLPYAPSDLVINDPDNEPKVAQPIQNYSIPNNLSYIEIDGGIYSWFNSSGIDPSKGVVETGVPNNNFEEITILPILKPTLVEEEVRYQSESNSTERLSLEQIRNLNQTRAVYDLIQQANEADPFDLKVVQNFFNMIIGLKGAIAWNDLFLCLVDNVAEFSAVKVFDRTNFVEVGHFHLTATEMEEVYRCGLLDLFTYVRNRNLNSDPLALDNFTPSVVQLIYRDLKAHPGKQMGFIKVLIYLKVLIKFSFFVMWKIKFRKIFWKFLIGPLFDEPALEFFYNIQTIKKSK